jgi:hypothetical protein
MHIHSLEVSGFGPFKEIQKIDFDAQKIQITNDPKAQD